MAPAKQRAPVDERHSGQMTHGPAVDALASSNRILVVGPSGSGKTYLSLRLGRILGHRLIHLDARFWRSGWVSTPQAEWRQTVESLTRQERWIMDGTYESTLDLRIPAAETIIVIERSRWICLWGVIRRAMMYGRGPRPDAPPKQPIDLSYLRYIWHYPARTRPLVDELIEKHGSDKCVLVLRGAREIEELMSELEVRTRGGAG